MSTWWWNSRPSGQWWELRREALEAGGDKEKGLPAGPGAAVGRVEEVAHAPAARRALLGVQGPWTGWVAGLGEFSSRIEKPDVGWVAALR